MYFFAKGNYDFSRKKSSAIEYNLISLRIFNSSWSARDWVACSMWHLEFRCKRLQLFIHAETIDDSGIIEKHARIMQTSIIDFRLNRTGTQRPFIAMSFNGN